MNSQSSQPIKSGEVEGKINFVLYPRTGFTKDYEWCVLQVIINGKRMKAKGEMRTCFNLGDVFTFEGSIVNDPKFGETFVFTGAKRSQKGETGSRSYLKYLFGPKTAERIITHFVTPEEALEVFKEDAPLLLQVKGVAQKTVNKAKLKHQDNEIVEVLFTNLKPYGMTLELALKLFKKYGDEVMDKVETNPYALMYDLDLGFDICDNIARYFLIATDDDRRIYAGLHSSMRIAMQSSGHCYLKREMLIYTTGKRLNTYGRTIPPVYIEKAFKDLLDAKKLKLVEQFDIVYYPAIEATEQLVANKLLDFKSKSGLQIEEVDKLIAIFEKKEGITFHSTQKEAIKLSVSEQISVITGPPGAGKTTILNCVLFVQEEIHKANQTNATPSTLTFGLAAPTGKAAKRMNEATHRETYTIHKLLDYRMEEGEWKFTYNENNKLPYDSIVIDEFSMVDLNLTYRLLSAIRKDAKILIVGDSDQLPSVSAGNVLGDILTSKMIPVSYLTEIFRQKNGSTILDKTIAIAKEHPLDLSNCMDFDFIEGQDSANLLPNVIQKIKESVKEFGLDEVQVLAPMRSHDLGVFNLNKVLQAELNPGSPYKTQVNFRGTIYRVGDKVIQIAQEGTEDLINGQVGRISEIQLQDIANGLEETIYVDYEGDIKSYTRDRYDKFTLFYAGTIHKSQGSEWKAVFIPFCSEHKHMLQKRLIYTATSRAKQYLCYFGDKVECLKSVKASTETKRNTLLAERLCGTVTLSK